MLLSSFGAKFWKTWCGLCEVLIGRLGRLGANFTNIFRAFLVSYDENGQQKQISFPKSAPCGDSTRVPVRTFGTFSCPSDGFCCKMCFSKLKKGAKKMCSFHYKRDDLRKIHTFRTNFGT